MGLQLAGRWVWDFWLVQERGLWHVFYLHAPQTPDDPDRRHFSARIGHATSADLNSDTPFWRPKPEYIPICDAKAREGGRVCTAGRS